MDITILRRNDQVRHFGKETNSFILYDKTSMMFRNAFQARTLCAVGFGKQVGVI